MNRDTNQASADLIDLQELREEADKKGPRVFHGIEYVLRNFEIETYGELASVIRSHTYTASTGRRHSPLRRIGEKRLSFIESYLEGKGITLFEDLSTS